jgi:hypothetical protein
MKMPRAVTEKKRAVLISFKGAGRNKSEQTMPRSKVEDTTKKKKSKAIPATGHGGPWGC